VNRTAATVTVLWFVALRSSGVAAQAPGALAQRIQQIVDRPEYRHSTFGIAFYDLDSRTPVYTLNADRLFVPGSTTKLVTEGTVFELLGADYRFHTQIYRTGPIKPDGTLAGDLVLVASGDPNLSARIRPDGTLAFENHDHAYDASADTRAVPGDPLLVIHELADQVVAHHIKRISGHVLIDISLFPEGDRELGTGVVISPIAVNDNLVDVTIAPGAAPGAPVTVTPSPATSYVRFVNHATTAPPDSQPEIRWASDSAGSDGMHTVTVTGRMPAGKPAWLFSYAVPQPSRFAEVVLVEALRARGVRARVSPAGVPHDFKALAAFYSPDRVVAEHVSPPLKEEVKVTLKVSQNLHASMTPYLLGALLAHDGTPRAGLAQEHDFLERAGLDLSAASQGDGAGGAAHFTPDFMTHFLAYMATRPNFSDFLAALPILGRDGTLWKVQPDSPAAGHVFAKTGTYAEVDHLNHGLMVNGKGLAGYLTTPGGRRLAFAIYANNVPVSAEPDAIDRTIAQALGEIAAAGYEAVP
jgi:PBP4 family serine-type D-alanyl-D-alanine carboxypeptidase